MTASRKSGWCITNLPVAKPALITTGSVEEALCFGWVDSIIQKIDEESYARQIQSAPPR